MKLIDWLIKLSLSEYIATMILLFIVLLTFACVVLDIL